VAILALIFLVACDNHKITTNTASKEDWKVRFKDRLPLLGHRNWVLILDKAYPEQTAAGVETVYTNENLLDVLRYAKKEIDSSTHVNAEIFTDKELGFITPSQVANIASFRDSLNKILGSNTEVLPHDSVFHKIDAVTKLFKVLVLKTNETIPYSSVFIRLNCAYWDGNKEKVLRDSISAHQSSK